MVSVDVHGASGLDHFVHRFTHRVVRGSLIAIGRPDGRLSCLAKSEASILLSAKQAAFIRNPDYRFEGSGPEIVTLGHNPFEPNLGLAYHIVLHNGAMRVASSASLSGSLNGNFSFHGSNHGSTHGQYSKSANSSIEGINRRKFVDEYIFDRLFLAKKPFTYSILRALRRTFDSGNMIVRSSHRGRPSISSGSMYYRVSRVSDKESSIHALTPSVNNRRGQADRSKSTSSSTQDEPLPYGVHHIDPSIRNKSVSLETS
jgi:hypothetical protein